MSTSSGFTSNPENHISKVKDTIRKAFEPASQLERLQKRSVVTFDLYRNKKQLEIGAAGDSYYDVLLTKEEVRLLIEEITVLWTSMED